VRKLARALLYGLAALGLLMVVATFTPLVPWYARALSGDWSDANDGVLIVLGGGTIDKDMLAQGSYWRCVYGARAWQQGKFREVVVSGEGVAGLMRDFLVSHGVPASAIRVEDRSSSTRENALFVKAMVAGTPGRKVLLTSDYHVFRARGAFRKAGLEVTTRAFPDALKAATRFERRWPAFLTLCEETVKIVYYKARGWI
jgi:uncharacterized SAM-binding protein YcdF (DUF218 family)